MKNLRIPFATGRVVGRICLGAMLAGFIGWTGPAGRAQPADDDEQGGQVLTRGPVHEAFAGVISYNPEPGVIVSKPPPELIEEIPPEEKPEGDDVAWIPGYWAWDDERDDYLWISGTWRTVPPGREWMAGYWRDTGQGYQWISGYWADADAQETTYLPPPPATLEIGANIDAPSDDYGWTPGCWIWQENRYAWRAGYWAQGRADWVWVPACYVWTPRGFIFVEGFWDYPLERRGLLFAPIYYQSRGYARRGYSYTPRIVISVSCFNDNLFLRPRYHHYYFGDYYGPRYERDGFYMAFSYQSGRRGYDPFYCYDRWSHRTERDWDSRYRASYQYRRDHEAARPPRTWAAQLTINARPALAGQVRIVAAAPLTQVARSRDNPVRFQSVAQGDRQKLAQRGREVQQFRDSRQSVEARAVVPAGRNENRAAEPARVSAPRSPIVARPVASRPGNQAPPARPQSPRADPPASSRPDARGRAPDADRRNPPETRPPERNVPAERRMPDKADKAREDAQREAQEAQKKAQQDAEQRAREARDEAQAVEKDRQQAAERAEEATARTRDESRRKVQQAEQKAGEAAAQAQRDAEERSRTARDESAQKAPPEEKRANDREEARPPAQPPREERAREPAARDRNDDQPRREIPPPPRAQPGDERRGKPAPNAKPAPPKPRPVEKPKPDDDSDDRKKDKEPPR